MSGLSDKRMKEVMDAKRQYGVDGAAEHLGISRETVKRYCRRGMSYNEEKTATDIVKEDPLLARIKERYSDKELKLLASGGLPMEYKHTPVHDFTGKTVKIGYMTDTHIGSVYTDYSYIEAAREQFAYNYVDMVVHSGDVTEGLSNRPDHVYQCTEYGYDAQKERAIEIFKRFDFAPLYAIDGNHDRWYIKTNGAKIVKDIADHVDNMEFIGHDEGDIVIGDDVTIKLWHGEDGSSYAHSYRLQKLIESLQGGQKPNILIAGHVHKYGHFFERNIQCISAGSIQKQTKWMRGKRLPAHVGFGILEATVNESGVGKLRNTFYPFYS